MTGEAASGTPCWSWLQPQGAAAAPAPSAEPGTPAPAALLCGGSRQGMAAALHSPAAPAGSRRGVLRMPFRGLPAQLASPGGDLRTQSLSVSSALLRSAYAVGRARLAQIDRSFFQCWARLKGEGDLDAGSAR